MLCPDFEELVEFARQEPSAQDTAIVEHIARSENCRNELRIINETLAADDWAIPDGPDDVASVICARQSRPEREEPGGLALLRRKGFIQTASIELKGFDPTCPGGKGMIQKGREIIVNPELGQRNGSCWPAKEPYISRFIENGFSFEKNFTGETLSALREAGGLAKRLGTSIAFNVQEWTSQGRTMPLFDLAASPFGMAPSFLRDKDIDKTSERTVAHPFVKWLRRTGIIPALGGYSRESESAIEGANECRIFELRGGKMIYRIFAMFVTPVSKDGELLHLTDGMYMSLTGKDGYVHKIKNDNSESAPACTFIVLGTAKGFSQSISPGSLPHIFEMLVTPCGGEYWDAAGGWTVDYSSRRLSSAREKAFVHSLYPQTIDDLSKRMFAYLEARTTGGHTATMDEGRIALRLPEGADYFVARVYNHMLQKWPSRCYILESLKHSGVGDSIALGTPDKRSSRKRRFPDELSRDEQWKRAIWRLLRIAFVAAASFLLGAIVYRAIQVNAIGKVQSMGMQEALNYMLNGTWGVLNRFGVATGVGTSTLMCAIARRLFLAMITVAKRLGDKQC